MRQLLKQLIPLLKQMRRYQKVNQPTGYTLYRRECGEKEWNTLTQQEKGPWNTKARAIRRQNNYRECKMMAMLKICFVMDFI